MKEFLSTIVLEAGGIAKKLFAEGVSYRTKSAPDDLITEADERVNEYLIGEITKAFPKHRIHSEELAADINPEGEIEWIIDPIDGTRNFAVGNPLWCIMVGVSERGVPRYSAILSPMLDRYYYAERGHGAFLNGLPIKTGSTGAIDHALGFLAPAPSGVFFEEYIAAVEPFFRRGGWLVNNATMLSAAFLAHGALDFFASNCGFDHDYVAPALLCTEAGAIVTDCHGNPWQRGRRDIVIANPSLHPGVLELLNVRRR